LDQDRNLELQRSHERLNQMADLVLAQVKGSISDWKLGVQELNDLPPIAILQARFPEGVTFVEVSENKINIYPERPLLFTPVIPSPKATEPDAFDGVDELEFREQQYERAIALLKSLAARPAIRAEALLRLARIEYKANQPKAALDTYAKLVSENAVTSSGMPYALLAMRSRCRILVGLHRKPEAQSEASNLRASLLRGRWPISRDAFDYHWADLDALGLEAGQPPRASVEFSTTIASLFHTFQNFRDQGSNVGGVELLPDRSLLIWYSRPDRLSAVLAPPDWLHSAAKPPASSGDIHWRMLALGEAKEPGFTVTRSLEEAGIPGPLEFSSLQPISGPASSRRSLIVGGAALMLIVILGAGYVVHRAISRELQVAQLQSDFVAAVSHDFRSPLTTLRSITEMLVQQRIPSEARRQQSYIFLDHETARLHRLVEDLLDFGRMESGRKQYWAADHDAFELARTTVDDFIQQAKTNGFNVETNLGSADGSTATTIHVDQEAFGRALRNLLDNAMKYSPACRTVWVNGAVQDHSVIISVRDQGMGIGAEEQKAVFRKFVRGDAAKKAGIKGTGIGLAMVQQIVHSMGGEVRLQSEIGVGSTFTLVIPLVDSKKGAESEDSGG